MAAPATSASAKPAPHAHVGTPRRSCRTGTAAARCGVEYLSGCRLDLRAGVADVAHPALRIFFKAAMQYANERVGKRGRQTIPVRLLRDHGRDDVGRGLAVESAAPCQQFVEHDTERPDVGAPVDGETARLFRCHVRSRAEHDAGAGDTAGECGGVHQLCLAVWGSLERLGEPEVEHLHRAIRGQEDVGRLQVAVDNALFVSDVERLRDLPSDRQRIGNRDPAPARRGDQVGERLPVDELHHQRAGGARFLETMDVRDIRMIERRKDLRFALEPRETIAITGEQVGQDLDRDVAVQPRVACPEYLAHPSPADRGRDGVRTDPIAGSERHGARIIGPDLNPNWKSKPAVTW